MTRRLSIFTIAIGLVLGLASQATLAGYTTGFESSDDAGYVAGNTIRFIDGWQITQGSLGTANVTNNPAEVASGSQAVAVLNQTFGTADVIWERQFAPETGLVRVQFSMAFLDGPTSSLPEGEILIGDGSIMNSSDWFGGAVRVMLWYSNATGNRLFRVISNPVDDGSSTTWMSSFTGDIQDGAYYDFVADLDTVAGTYDLTIDGPGIAFSATGLGFLDPNVAGQEISSVNLRSGLGAIRTKVGFDDISIAPVPEPASLGLMVAAGAFLGLRRRSRK